MRTDKNSTSEDSLHFAVIGDVHVGRIDDEFVTAVQLCNKRDDIDFVIVLGDLVQHAVEENVDAFISQLERLTKPVYLAVGNHDLERDRYGFDADAAIRERLEGPWRESFTYSFEKGEWLFIVVGMDVSASPYTNTYVNRYKGHVSRQGRIMHVRNGHLSRLQALLEQSGERPACVVIHAPLIPMGKRHHERGCWDQCRILEERQLWSLIQARPNVRLVLSGHQHFNQAEVVDGQLHCVTQDILGEYADGPGIRLIELTSQAVSSRMIWTDVRAEAPGPIGSLHGDRCLCREW